MAFTTAQRTMVYQILADAERDASKAMRQAAKTYDNTPGEYGGGVIREAAAVMFSLRKAQYEAARDAAKAYFNNYIAPEAA